MVCKPSIKYMTSQEYGCHPTVDYRLGGRQPYHIQNSQITQGIMPYSPWHSCKNMDTAGEETVQRKLFVTQIHDYCYIQIWGNWRHASYTIIIPIWHVTINPQDDILCKPELSCCIFDYFGRYDISFSHFNPLKYFA